MQVSKEGIERIKGANELSSVVAERGIEVKKKGRVLVARCPFHEERTPSFTITPSRGLFHCFGCGAAGDVIGFVTKYDKVSFGGALDVLAKRAGLDLQKLMESGPRIQQKTPLQALTPPRAHAGNGNGTAKAPTLLSSPPDVGPLLARVVEHYHRTFCEREDAQAYLIKRGITDTDLIQALKIGYADGSLLKTIPALGETRDQLMNLGIITAEGRELLGGCIVVPIPDPLTEQVQSGGYGSASEYIRELVRKDQKERGKARLESLLLEGLDSGEAIPITPEFWQGLFLGVLPLRPRS